VVIPIPPITVIHVEDDPLCRETIADQLAEQGFVVRSFADATSLADGSEADIILLDWHLPGVSGIELLVELRRSFWPAWRPSTALNGCPIRVAQARVKSAPSKKIWAE
jgi:CheY-like chemotaxis protein